MLYVTTRNNRDVYTTHKVLTENRDENGGFYIPFHPPQFSSDDIASLKEKSFNQCVADILNILFGTDLTSWDIDFCIGRYPVRLNKIGHRTDIIESWHNPEWNYQRMENNLSSCLRKDNSYATDWVRVAIRIAVLFGVFGELQRAGIKTADISVVSGDFSIPISAWYARKWGLPIGNIVCCCNENSNLWDMICHGHLRTNNISIPTVVPEADVVVPAHLERLVYEIGGENEVSRYLDCCRKGNSYDTEDQLLQRFRQGIYVSVVSSKRIKETIPNIYRSHGYVMDTSTSLAYAGLLDYRSKTGVTRHALVLSEKSPLCTLETVSGLLGITSEELKRII